MQAGGLPFRGQGGLEHFIGTGPEGECRAVRAEVGEVREVFQVVHGGSVRMQRKGDSLGVVCPASGRGGMRVGLQSR